MGVNDMRPDDAVEVIRLRARSFVESLDRTMLGSFAVDADALHMVHLSEMLLLVVSRMKQSGVYDQAVYDALWSAYVVLDTEIQDAAQFWNEHQFRVYTELFYWWGVSEDTELIDSPLRSSVLRTEDDERMRLIATSPLSFHSFFEAGVWDVPVIERCIAEGVDPEIVLSL